MITTLISMYIAGTLAGGELPQALPPAMPWSNSKLSSVAADPIRKSENIAPVIKAKSAIAVDLKSGGILFEKNIYQPLPIASITKLMTAIITLEENNLEDVVTISRAVSRIMGSKIWLYPGEQITVENLLYAAIINSANDAAAALAQFNSGTNEKFVAKMNQKTKNLGLIGTYFYNPTGLDGSPSDPDYANTNTQPSDTPKTAETGKNQNPALIASAFSSQQSQPYLNDVTGNTGSASDSTGDSEIYFKNDNYSTAYDLAILAHYAFDKSFIRLAAVKQNLEVTSTDGKLNHKLKSTNDLLRSYLKVLGLKTGTTDQAGECLIAIIETAKGNQILTVVLNSPHRYNETKVLVDWVTRSYDL